MNKTCQQTRQYFEEMLPGIDCEGRDVVICPTYLSLKDAVEATAKTNVKIGAQNMHYEESGAFTGEVSAEMLKEAGVQFVIIGHSERRTYYAETNESVNKKVKKALLSELTPIVCVGENLDQRQKGETFDFVREQIEKSLEGINDERLVVAYEPIWAIGTGVTATSEQAEEVCEFIRGVLGEKCKENSEKIRILYGGSVNASNIKELMSCKDIDGVLVGGASLKSDFVKIVNYE